MAAFAVTRNDISPALSRMIVTAGNPVPILRAMGADHLNGLIFFG